MTRLFKRAAAITIAHSVVGDFFRTTEEVTVRDLRVSFVVEKTLRDEPNTATVTIYNLAERTRSELKRRPLQVRIEAGYDGELSRVFVGDVRFGPPPTLNGVDWIAKLQLGDGDRAYHHARTSRSFKAGTSKRAVLAELAGSMGLKLPSNVAEAQALTEQFAAGIALHDLSSAEMSRICKSSGLDWSVQDGRLQVLGPDDVRADEAIVVSQDTGMVDVPEYGTPDRGSKKPPLKVRMLLHTGLTPGGRIELRSRSINGLFKLQRVRHVGDTHGADWHSEMEALAA